MYPTEFDYFEAESVSEAINLWEQHTKDGRQVKYLAGGHSLLPMMKSRLAAPDVLIDIGDINELAGIERLEDRVRVGATTRYADASESTALERAAPVITDAVRQIGDRQVRNRGTFGGNVAHADPASDLPGAILAADATVHANGPNGERTFDVGEFFQAMYVSALDDGEILTDVEIPHSDAQTGSAYAKRPSPSSGYALVGVAAVIKTTTKNPISHARIAINGVMDHAVRLTAVEEELIGNPPTNETIVAAARRAPDSVDHEMAMDDNHASGQFRTKLLEPYTYEALESALDRLTGGQ